MSALLDSLSATFHGDAARRAALDEALRAGLPQLIVPRAYDQFDNAARAERLGFGLGLRAYPENKVNEEAAAVSV